jgi:glutathione-independent formaldehyde dehydrogenase
MLMMSLEEAATIPRMAVKERFFLRKAGGPFAGFFANGHAPAPAVIVAIRVSNFLQEILHLLACSAHTWQTVLSLHFLSTQSDAAPPRQGILMKALVYHGPKKVSVDKVPDAKLEKLTDVVIKLTTTNICGSDLHMYEGRTDVEKGKILGHENLGEVVEVGKAVDAIKKGDKVVLPFNVGCGFCANCERGLSGYCLTCADPKVMPGMAGAAYGFAGMGPYSGGQAEYLRVPYADYNCLQLPDDADEKEKDYVMLADIFPTGWHATRLANLQPGQSIIIFGAGPVGLMAAMSARIQGASQIFVVDGQPDRLRLAREIGAIPIDDKDDNVGDQIRAATGGLGADCGAECVGYQCHNAHGKEVPNITMNALVDAVKATGTIGVIGVFVPQDPHAEDKLARKGQIAFDFGKFWFKGQKMGTGQCNVKAYNRRLRDLIHFDKADPSIIVSHELPLAEAPDAYKHFDNRDKGWTKVILHPHAA